MGTPRDSRANSPQETDPTMPDSTVPVYCVAAGLVGLGGAAMATSFHADGKNIHKVCVGGSLLGVGALTAAVVHHSSPSTTMPHAQCIMGTAAGLGALGYASQTHSNKTTSGLPPAHCIFSSIGIAAAAVATALMFSSKK